MNSEGPQASPRTSTATEIVVLFDGATLHAPPSVADMVDRGRLGLTVVRWLASGPTRRDYRSLQGAEADITRALRDGINATVEMTWKTSLRSRS